MTSRSVISVIIPTYEPDALLDQTISSVLAEAGRGRRANFTINVPVVDDACRSVNATYLNL
jgi:glycosyltransferase involved in cell wall biosynthesis